MRNEFPLLKNTIYLDSAAAMLKPVSVIQVNSEILQEFPINPHSIDSALGSKLYAKLEEATKLIASFIDATKEEIIFTSGTTDSLNRVAQMFKIFLKKDDKIILSSGNHSSNATPWIEIAKQTGAKIVFSDDLISDIDSKTKIVSYAQVNNSLSQNIDKYDLYDKVKSVGAVLVNDAAQAINSEIVSLEDSDVVVFSGNKIYSPMGVGVLAINKELLEVLKPSFTGGGSVVSYDEESIRYKEGIRSFRAGTPNTAGIISMAKGIEFFKDNFNPTHLNNLYKYAYKELNKLDKITMISKYEDSIVLFKVNDHSSQDVVSFLGHRDIILRAGKHCAIYLFNKLNIDDSIRMSFGIYNTKKDIDAVVEIIKNEGDFIDV
ncbi:MAG: aminotransferase class V-fold PLP-dependent enzyme [Mycoplasmataceae bacterium]|nr:aminotransferase class V-fold PLP-dependent enzyme [Mycoplasmataceae bacterium]